MGFLFDHRLELSDHLCLGGKGAALARLGRMGFAVPPWFAVPAGETWTPAELATALGEIGAGPYAVRSSGMSEDGSGHSFAGQFESHLEVPADEVASRIAQVRISADSDSICAYCREQQLPLPATPTVLVQRMIDPKWAGVAFSADPVSGRRQLAVVSAVAGTGEKLVSGEVDGELWTIDRDGQVVERPEAALLVEVEVGQVAQLARRCEQATGRPQDIEWAIDREGRLWLLQSRPITTLRQLPDPADSLRVWDNSNIAESYGGVTTPLTFSFARRVYESVYREFCRLMSVPEHRIDRADDVFPQMLGLIQGRTYYNLASWYRVLALLPGFQLNRGFMEQMMGVKEPLPDRLVETIVAESRTGRLSDALALVRTGAGLVSRLLGLNGQVKRFQLRLDRALAPLALESLSGEELVAHYRDLERRLLRKWDAPLVNDFFAMIYYGLLRGLCVKWLGDRDGTLQNDLLARTGGIISAEPPRRIMRMASLVREIPGLADSLIRPTVTEPAKLALLRQHSELAAEFTRYLEDFGDRCLEELKLESPTVRDDASTLLTSIGALASRPEPVNETPEAGVEIPSIRHPIKRMLFRHVLKQTKERVRCRENLRFERTRLFGRVRGIFRELGKRLAADDLLLAEDDVFYLELGEILALWEGTGTISDPSRLATQRRAEFEACRAGEPPPDRFETHGPVHRYARFESTRPEPEAGEFAGELRGTGACPGRVTGRVRVVLDPRSARLEAGEILVALQTDPGWVVLFPAAAGLLVERGSLLSHSAIVSRELRLPCIVSLPGVTRTLKTGDLVEMDGATGQVRILEPAV